MHHPQNERSNHNLARRYNDPDYLEKIKSHTYIDRYVLSSGISLGYGPEKTIYIFCKIGSCNGCAKTGWLNGRNDIVNLDIFVLI